MRVALITVAYPPLRSSGANQMRDLAQAFAAAGHVPTAIVADSSLQVAWRCTREEGIEVLRLRSLPTRDINFALRGLSEFLLPYAMFAAYRRSSLASERWDAIVYYSPSIFLGPFVARLKRLGGRRSYLIQRDLFPDWAVDVGVMRRGFVYGLLKRIERQQYRAADVIGVQAPSNAPHVLAMLGSSSTRVEVLWNWLADGPPTASRIKIEETPLRGRTIFVYTGNMGVAQGASVFLEVAERLRDRGDIGFLFVGRGTEAPALHRSAKERRLSNVMFHDEIDAAEIPGLLAQCHVGMLALDPRHTSHNIPGKFLAYMRAGIPVLGRINANNDLVALICREGVGRVSFDGSASVAEDARALVADAGAMVAMAGRCRALADRMFAPSAAVEQIVRAIGGLDTRDAHN